MHGLILITPLVAVPTKETPSQRQPGEVPGSDLIGDFMSILVPDLVPDADDTGKPDVDQSVSAELTAASPDPEKLAPLFLFQAIDLRDRPVSVGRISDLSASPTAKDVSTTATADLPPILGTLLPGIDTVAVAGAMIPPVEGQVSGLGQAAFMTGTPVSSPVAAASKTEPILTVMPPRPGKIDPRSVAEAGLDSPRPDDRDMTANKGPDLRRPSDTAAGLTAFGHISTLGLAETDPGLPLADLPDLPASTLVQDPWKSPPVPLPTWPDAAWPGHSPQPALVPSSTGPMSPTVPAGLETPVATVKQTVDLDDQAPEGDLDARQTLSWPPLPLSGRAGLSGLALLQGLEGSARADGSPALPDPDPASPIPGIPAPKTTTTLPFAGLDRPAWAHPDGRVPDLQDAGHESQVSSPGPLSSFHSPSSVHAPSPHGIRPAAPDLPVITAQIVDGLARAQNGTTTLTLSPEELGRVNLSFQQDAQTQDRLVVMLNFDRPETMDLFRRHADQLADALRAAGFAGVQIGFGGAGTGGTEHGAATSEASDSLPDGTSSTKDLTPLPAPSRPLGHGALDLRL